RLRLGRRLRARDAGQDRGGRRLVPGRPRQVDRGEGEGAAHRVGAADRGGTVADGQSWARARQLAVSIRGGGENWPPIVTAPSSCASSTMARPTEFSPC